MEMPIAEKVWRFLRRDREIAPSGCVEKKEERKKVIVLIDFENLAENSKYDPEQKRLGWFLDYLSFQEKKDIIFFEVFTPSSRASNAESVVFALYSANIIHMPLAAVVHKCPRNLVTRFRQVNESGKRELRGELKEVDRVDSRMIARGKAFTDHLKDLTEIIIVSNDGDFRELRNYTHSHGVRFRLYPPSEAFSQDYLKMYNGEKEVFLLKEDEGGEKE